MADKNNTTEESGGHKRKVPLKTLAVLIGVLLLEGAAISAAFLVAGKPADAQADLAATDAAAEAEKAVEVLVVAEKFQNTRTGRTYLYDTEVYIIVRRKNADKVTAHIKTMAAKISGDIGMIFRRAEPSHLLEPSLESLKRQIKASLDETLGRDADGASLVDEVLFKKFTQYRADI